MTAPRPPEAPAGAAPSDLTAKTFAGLRWTYSGIAVSVVLQLTFTMVVSRVLEPRAFGLLALAYIALRFATYFARLGVGPALVQKPELTEHDVRAAFTASVGMGLLLVVPVWVVAPVAASVFDEPSLVPVLRIIGFTLPLAGLSTTSQGLLRREMRFRTLAGLEVSSYAVAYFAVGLTLALAGADVYSLVAAALVQQLVVAAIGYRATRHALRPVFLWVPYRRLLSFGGRVSVIGFLEFIGSELDTMAVGRYASPGVVGYYNRAYLLATLPIQHLATGLSNVLLPSFSQIQRDMNRMRSAFLSAMGIAAIVLLPISAWTSLAATEIVSVVLGPRWEPVASALPILAVAAVVALLSHFPAVLCEARAELNSKLLVQLGHLTVLAGLLAVAAGRGLQAYALAFLAAQCARHGLYLVVAQTRFQTPVRDLLVRYWAAVTVAALVAAAVAGGRYSGLWIGVPTAPLLAIEVLLGAFAFVVGLRFGPARAICDDLRSRLAYAGLVRSSSSPVARLVGVILPGGLSPTVSVVPEAAQQVPEEV